MDTELQELLDLLKHSCQDLKKEFSNLSPKLSPEKLAILKKFAPLLQSHINQLEKIRNESQIKNSKTASLEAKQKAALEEIAKDLFVIACASQKPISKALDFRKQCLEKDLNVKDLNQFSSNLKINPLIATLLANKPTKEITSEIETLTKNGANINFKDANGNNMAHYTVSLGTDREMVDFLISKNVDFNAKNSNGITPLDLAILKGDEKTVRILVERNAKQNFIPEAKKEKPDAGPERPTLKVKEESKKIFPEQQKQNRSEELAKLESENLAKREMELQRLIEISQRLTEMELAAEKHRKATLKTKQEKEEQEKKILAEKVSAEEKISVEKTLSERNADLRIESEQTIAPTLEIPTKNEGKKFTIVEAELSSPISKPESQTKSSLDLNFKEEIPARKKELIEEIMGIDLTKVDINQLLFSSAKRGNVITTILLIQAGADVNSTQDGKNVLVTAMESGNVSPALISVLTIFSSESSKNTAKEIATNQGKNSLKQLIERTEEKCVASTREEKKELGVAKEMIDLIAHSLERKINPEIPRPTSRIEKGHAERILGHLNMDLLKLESNRTHTPLRIPTNNLEKK